MAKLVTALVVLLLAGLKLFKGGRDKAEIAEAVLTERPVSHAELVSCQLEVTRTINDQFLQLRKDFMDEIKQLHEKINANIHPHVRSSDGDS